MKNNMNIIETNDYVLCFSYGVLVAYKDKINEQFMKTEKKWSRTSSKHINSFIDKTNIPVIVLSQEQMNDFYIVMAKDIQEAILKRAKIETGQ